MQFLFGFDIRTRIRDSDQLPKQELHSSFEVNGV